MNRFLPLSACIACGLLSSAARAAPDATETIVFLRHAEKPEAGLGQLDCQGLNRALALTAVLRKQFGVPDAMFAPNPTIAKPDHGITYDYIRPLATLEPAAIAFGLPIDVNIGYADGAALTQALEKPTHGKLAVVAWEHHQIAPAVRRLLADHGNHTAQVQDWPDADFDSLYVVSITPAGAVFEHRQEGLNGEPHDCPEKK